MTESCTEFTYWQKGKKFGILLLDETKWELGLWAMEFYRGKAIYKSKKETVKAGKNLMKDLKSKHTYLLPEPSIKRKEFREMNTAAISARYSGTGYHPKR